MTVEQRARDEAIVLAALPGRVADLSRTLLRGLFDGMTIEAKRNFRNSIRRFKRAGKVRLNGKVWEAAPPVKVCCGCGLMKTERGKVLSRIFFELLSRKA